MVADDFYHKYKQDIATMKTLGIKNFRLSFSWSRLLTNGTTDSVNAHGVAFYNSLLDELIGAGIEPWVTLYHWDLPLTFYDKTDQSAWLNKSTTVMFDQYADFCFLTFGSKVKKWITFNEPQTFTWVAYGVGAHAPGRCSPSKNPMCAQDAGGGNSSTEPYITSYHVLIAHGKAVKTYRDKYQQA